MGDTSSSKTETREEPFVRYRRLVIEYWRVLARARKGAIIDLGGAQDRADRVEAQKRLPELRKQLVTMVVEVEDAATDLGVRHKRLFRAAYEVERVPRQKIEDLLTECIATGKRGPRPRSAPRSGMGSKIVIGHGRSSLWLELKDFVRDRCGLEPDEYNLVATAGYSRQERLQEMLDSAALAFIVMTAEDEQPDGTVRARENVVHEVGLFQGRLGFKRAIVLMERGCVEFSNIAGLDQIRFPKDDIKARFEDVRQVLEREKLIASVRTADFGPS